MEKDTCKIDQKKGVATKDICKHLIYNETKNILGMYGFDVFLHDNKIYVAGARITAECNNIDELVEFKDRVSQVNSIRLSSPEQAEKL